MAETKPGGKKTLRLLIVPAVALLLIVLTLVVSGLVFVPAAIAWGEAAPMADALGKSDEILVYIDESYSDAEAKSVGSKINSLDNIYQIRFVSREEALEQFIADHEGDEAFEGVQAEYLRHRFLVTVEDPGKTEQTAAELRKIPGVADVSSHRELYGIYQSAKQTAELMMVLAAVIGVTVIFLIAVLAVVLEVVIYKRSKHI